MFQFPANPTLGQVYTPIPGVSYKWNGTGWAPFSTSFATVSYVDSTFVPLSQKAAASGVATLDSNLIVPDAQIAKALPNGVASLDSTGQVPLSQLGNVPASGGITLGTPQTATGNTVVDFTSIPAGVKVIYVMLSGISLTGADAMIIRLGDSSGFAASGYTSNVSQGFGSSISTTSRTNGFGISPSTSATYSGLITLALQDATNNVWVLNGNLARTDSTQEWSSGIKALSGTLDRLRLTSVTPTSFSAGTVNISYQS